MTFQPTLIDPAMLQTFDSLQRAYTTITSDLKPPQPPAVDACGFLAAHTFWFGSGALKLATQGLIPPAAALTRTCIEAEACSRYIFACPQPERDQKASRFLEFKEVCLAEYAERYQTGNHPRLVAVRQGLNRTKLTRIVNTGRDGSWQKRFKDLKAEWNFSKLVKMPKMTQPLPGVSSQGFDLLLVNQYDMYSYFVHPNPVAYVFAPHISPDEICQTVLISTINTIGILLHVAGRDNQDFVKAGEAFIKKYEMHKSEQRATDVTQPFGEQNE